ncbi:MAG: dihydroorotase family protein [Candidatus Odinarchaeota archaeon]|nr:dihydroorotase family protein [Candidatus Odinarchaeota archaeon]
MKTVIKNGKFVFGSEIVEGGLVAEDDKITTIAKTVNLPKDADKIIDAKGNLILPGVIDGHVHVLIPPYLKDNFETGTRAAAVGGVTTIVEMPSLFEYITTFLDKLKWKIDLGEKESYVDFALYGGEIQTEEDLRDIQKLAEAGVVGFKITMGGETAYKHEGIFYEALRRIQKANSMATVHAENNQLLDYFYKEAEERLKKGEKVLYSESRPNVVEAEAISRAILYSKYVGNRLHIAHMSTKEGVELVRRAQYKNLPVTAEATVHHLLFSRDDYEKYKHYIITNPPQRSKEDVESLWNAINEGVIANIVTDHCAFTKEEKDEGIKNVLKTPAGIHGLETETRLILSEGVNKGRITLQKFIEVMAENPAKLYGLYPRKGVIAIGSDADVIIVDLKKEEKITMDIIQSVAGYTPYDGWIVKGVPLMTIVRGEIVAEGWEPVGKKGYGKFVPSKR